MIYIAFDANGTPLSVVNAIDEKMANAYWQGRGYAVHTVKSLDDYTPLDEHPTGVIELVKTKRVNIDTMVKGSHLTIVTR